VSAAKSDPAETAAQPSRWDVFQNPGYGFFMAALFLTGFAIQIQTVAVGWQVYDLTRNPFDLGLVGLSQFAPALILVLVTGTVSDRFSRRGIMTLCMWVEALVAGGLLVLTLRGNGDVRLVFMVMVLFGTARAFYNPARSSLITNIVKPAHLPKALAMNSSVNEVATICGPVAGGLLYGLAPEAAYGVSVVFLFAAGALVAMVPRQPRRGAPAGRSWSEVTAGFRFIRARRIIFGAISLDLFAVLLGGAFAMLPVYARDILDVGALGLGLLRAAPAVGAVLVAGVLMSYPIRRNAGKLMFASVAGFGFFTLVFALSKVVWLSVLALAFIGGFDMVSMVIRGTLVQLNTPDGLRGRVNAVNMIFIGASNELGEFRAGSMAALLGTVPSVALGAVVCMGICGLWYKIFPELRDVQELRGEEDA
tara:strand:- start:59845 stop:61107 length:1263 start_codon:yes stop_codon:yes gene_type:complete